MHLEALTPEGSRVFPRLRLLGFILGGGTGLALQLGHRISEDLDFFSEKEIAPGVLDEVEKELAGIGLSARVVVNNKDELTIFAGETKITFLYYSFPTVLPRVFFDDMAVFSVLEIAAMKAYALGRRGTMKDYVDLYFILKGGEALKSVAEVAEKKYGEAFDTRLFLEQLIYLEDVGDMPIRFLRGAVKRKELEQFFEKQVKNFTGSQQV